MPEDQAAQAHRELLGVAIELESGCLTLSRSQRGSQGKRAGQVGSLVGKGFGFPNGVDSDPAHADGDVLVKEWRFGMAILAAGLIAGTLLGWGARGGFSQSLPADPLNAHVASSVPPNSA
jgi:hypothetical protein